jgi:ABC-type transport system involved in multi-copper enzyme maturation permease subunit
MLWVFGLNPAVQVEALIEPRILRDIRIGWAGCIAFQLGLALLMLLTAATRLRREVMRGDVFDGITPRQARKARKKERKNQRSAPPVPERLIAEMPGATSEGLDVSLAAESISPAAANEDGDSASSARPARPPRTVGDWPVYWRECHARLFANRRSAWRLGIFFALAMGAGYILSDWRELRGVQEGFAFVFAVVMCLLATVVSATVITHEKESGAWPLLIAAPISGRELILSKAAGIARRLMVMTILIVAHFLLIGPLLYSLGAHLPLRDYDSDVYWNPTSLGEIWAPSLTAMFVIFSFNSVWAATGLFFSLRMRKTTSAVVCNLLLMLFVFVGVPLILATLDNMLNEYYGGVLSDRIDNYMPFAYIDQAFDVYSTTVVWLGRTLLTRNFTAWTLYVGCVHLAIAALILTQCAVAFDRVTGRAPQTRPLPPAGRDDALAPAL